MTKKQTATAVGAVLVALAGVLSQCPEEPPPAPRSALTAKPPADAGAPRPPKPPADAGKR